MGILLPLRPTPPALPRFVFLPGLGIGVPCKLIILELLVGLFSRTQLGSPFASQCGIVVKCSISGGHPARKKTEFVAAVNILLCLTVMLCLMQPASYHYITLKVWYGCPSTSGPPRCIKGFFLPPQNQVMVLLCSLGARPRRSCSDPICSAQQHNHLFISKQQQD